MRVQRCIAIALCFLFLPILRLSVASAASAPDVSAKSAVLIDGLSGTVLYEKNAYETMPMASTTKIMTTLLAVESGDLTREIKTTKEMVTVEGSSMGLVEGDTVTLEALCYGMLLCSGNDAATTTAIAMAGSLPAFAKKMNAKADALGMKQTNFVTPSGLDAEGHFSTAYDMALLGRAAMKNETFAAIASSRTARVSFGNPPFERTLYGHNKLLSMYADAVGIKTGFTKKSGRCLVSAARRDGALLIAVTLSAPDDWNDHIKMFEYGFSHYQEQTLNTNTEEVRLPVTGGEASAVGVLCEELTVSLLPGQAERIERTLLLPPFEYAPLGFGEGIGQAVFTLDGEEVARAKLVAAWDVAQAAPVIQPPPSLLDNLMSLLRFF